MFEDVDMDSIPGLGLSPPQVSQHDPELDVTVHHFTRSSVLSASSALLDIGRNIAQAASSTSGWHSVRPVAIRVSRAPRCEYTYSLTPPEVPLGVREQSLEIQEWGTSSSEDEIFITDDLDEFEVTDLTFLSSLILERRSTEKELFDDSLSYAELYGSAPPSVPQPVSSKRRRNLNLDLSPLHKFITEPHFLAPLAVDTSSAIQDRIAPFVKTTPTPVPPYTYASMQTKLKTPYTRGSWIIPIRGVPPWEGCTPANVIQQIIMPSPSFASEDNDTDSAGITWTHASLHTFWTFLLHTRRARKLGHISLSFHASPTDHNQPLPDTSLDFTSFQDNSQLIGRPLSGKPNAPAERRSLLSMDHFKIYCDVEYAMYIRSVLDAWFLDWDQMISSEDMDDNRIEGIKKKRIRPLEGARLAFVDEASRGLFIS